MRVLVCGGAGYIGAHVVRLLVERGDDVTVVDDLSSGDANRLPDGVELVLLDLAGPGAAVEATRVMSTRSVDAVIHFAAKKQVAESVRRPAWYYQQNVGGLANLVTAMEAAAVRALVFSSSAAVYGAPASGIGVEAEPAAPVNPYGETKLVGEWLCRDAATAWGLRSLSLRYFNVAGAGWPELEDPGAFNLVPIVLDKLLEGTEVPVFGSDYETSDGTCVRDYVHVLDLAEAHLVALDSIVRQQPPVHAINVGTGQGATVLQVLQAVERASGREVSYRITARRAGDPPRLTADVSLIATLLRWRASRTLDDVVASAWAARLARPLTTGQSVDP